MGAWVLFRCDTLMHAAAYYAALLGFSGADPAQHPVAQYANGLLIATLVAGILFAMPLATRLGAWRDRAMQSSVAAIAITADGAWVVWVFVASAAMLAAGTYNPFIYFRF
jgi:alginate O-acetyltransferase complex protein AlgI